jgi:hypothetical protein
MITLSLNKEIAFLPLTIKRMMWKFIRRDIATRDFDSWVCKDGNDELNQVLKEDSFLALVMADYNESEVIADVRNAVFIFLTKFPEPCLCSSFPDKTLLYPFADLETERIALLKQLDILKPIVSIENFSGEIRSVISAWPSRWYHSGQLCCCTECKSWWFVIFEESGSDYYLVRLSEEDAWLISQNPSWPNEHWPQNLKNWDIFLRLDFQNWNDLYEGEKKHMILRTLEI